MENVFMFRRIELHIKGSSNGKYGSESTEFWV